MNPLYPLRFRPLLKRAIWGGRRLSSHLNKLLGDGEDFAESWEIVDHGSDQSVVEYGPLKDVPLRQIMEQHAAALLGQHADFARFPLLFKFLDCNRSLSVQVHPDDAYAARLTPPDLGKTEAWVVLHAEPEARIYAGLKRGFDRHAFEREVRRGATELCLHTIEPQVGDCLFIPAGTVHALGAGLVVAEIQQASDTTFRLFDWNRLGSDGHPRPLHIDRSLDVIDYEVGPVRPRTPQATEKPHVERLVACDKFVLDRWRIEQRHEIGGDDRCHIVAVLVGQVHLANDPANQPLSSGQTVLIPAATGPIELIPSGSAILLDMYLPSP